jgi:hypothetical protein
MRRAAAFSFRLKWSRPLAPQRPSGWQRPHNVPCAWCFCRGAPACRARLGVHRGFRDPCPALVAAAVSPVAKLPNRRGLPPSLQRAGMSCLPTHARARFPALLSPAFPQPFCPSAPSDSRTVQALTGTMVRGRPSPSESNPFVAVAEAGHPYSRSTCDRLVPAFAQAHPVPVVSAKCFAASDPPHPHRRLSQPLRHQTAADRAHREAHAPQAHPPHRMRLAEPLLTLVLRSCWRQPP